MAFYTTLPKDTAKYFKDSFDQSHDEDWGSAYSGMDMRAILFATYPEGLVAIPAPMQLRSLTGISVSQHRDQFPVRRLGSSNPAGYTKGNRTIAGTLIFSQLGDYGLREILQKYSHLDYATLDEMPPVNLIITFVNEAGTESYFGLQGVRILDEGESFTLDEMEWYTTAAYVAMAKIPMRGRLQTKWWQNMKEVPLPEGTKLAPGDTSKENPKQPDESLDGFWNDTLRGITSPWPNYFRYDTPLGVK